ncbi:MAG: tail fiber domain-containing protein, partial [Bacteroidota bacterium]
IYKNGNAELNGALTIDSSYTFPVTDGTTGQVLQTDGNGNLSWVDEPTFTDTNTDNQTIDKLNLNGTTLEISLENDGEGDQTLDLASLQDNLGDHTATQNIQLNDNWLSNDGGNEGIQINDNGGVSTSNSLSVGGNITGVSNFYLDQGTQRLTIRADQSAGRIHFDVGGTNASNDAFVFGDLSNGKNALLTLGNVGVGTFSAPQKLTVGVSGDGTKGIANDWDTWSDKRLKRDFQEITNPLQKLNAINGYYYYWRADKPDQSKQIGVIAQEVETILPEIVSTNPDGYKSVDYSKLTAFLIEVNQAQQQEIDDLKAQVAKINQLEAMLERLEAQVSSNSTATNSTGEK